MSLGWYLNDTSELLRDKQNLYTSKAQLTRYINMARRKICKQTGCIPLHVCGSAPFGNAAQPGSMIPGAFTPGSRPTTTFQTIAGVEKYPFSFANAYVRDAYDGVKGIIDVISVSVSWGAELPALDWMPFEDFMAYARSFNTGVTSFPVCWSTWGDGENGEVWLYPIPVEALEMEWLVSGVPSDLVADSDYDALPANFKDAVKYYAAGMAYLASQRFSMAQVMNAEFNDSLGIDRAASDRGKTTNNYPRIFE